MSRCSDRPVFVLLHRREVGTPLISCTSKRLSSKHLPVQCHCMGTTQAHAANVTFRTAAIWPLCPQHKPVLAGHNLYLLLLHL